MGRFLKYALVFALLAFPAFAGQVWKLPTFGPIEAKPVFFDDEMAIASHDGFIYYVYWQSGALKGKANVGENVDDMKMGNNLIVAASGKGITILDKSGNITRRINVSETYYGVEAGDSIYATTEDGLEAYGYNGNLQWVLPGEGNPATAPLLLQDRIIYGSGSDLVVADLDGTETGRISVAPFWKSKPAFYNNIVFIGSTDGNMYAVDLGKGRVAWSFETGGWIMSDPLYSDGSLYFGSNDGYVYALNANSGRLLWKRQTQEAVQGGIETVTLGGKKMVLTGGNDNRVYALDAKNGNIGLVFSAGGWVHNPAFYGGMLFFGSYDGSYYAYIADRACSIDAPPPGEIVGYMPFNVSGRVFSQNPGAQVYVRVSDNASTGMWMPTSVSGNDWAYRLDPSLYSFGKLFLECKVSDSAGEESAGFTYRILLRDANAKKGRMSLEAPVSVTEDKTFAVRAYDEKGAPLDAFTVAVAGKSFSGKNGTAFANVSEPGTYSMLVRKTGYEDETVSLSVGYDLFVILSMVFTAIAVLAVVFYLFVYKKK